MRLGFLGRPRLPGKVSVSKKSAAVVGGLSVNLVVL
ncbi:hypothetical protein MGSAQ_000203 [marine sediment metagenome]|uniref:Uncharacterized protein n=1 Tax=marine sediment metagenome TaxID=412755 RepID=A0A1B6NYS1_9ZZZZ